MTKKHHYKEQDPFSGREAKKYENPIPSREYILEVLKTRVKPIKRLALEKLLGLEDPYQQEALRRRLRAMVRDYQLIYSSQGYVPSLEQVDYRGTLSLDKDRSGTLICEEDIQPIRLWQKETRDLWDGDEITVRVNRYDRDGDPVGSVVAVNKLVSPKVIGRVSGDESFALLTSQVKIPGVEIVIPHGDRGKAKSGDIVVVEVLRDKTNYTQMPLLGRVIEVLGDPGTPGIEVQMAIRKYELPHIWSEAIQKACKNYKTTIPKSAYTGRMDCRELPFVTIDGEDAKDFDDAVYCEARAKGGWRLFVAIADVGYYVKPHSALDKEAENRGNSVYFPGSVIPMLPEILSNGLCSLNPEEDRLCMVCEMTVSSHGQVTRSVFYEGVIRSQARMTYTEVAALLEGDKGLLKKYDNLTSHLECLHDVYEAFIKQRHERGAIEFDSLETKIIFGQKGKIA
ncbi:MAG TPA: RNB domain-containing ribonuclease, partial [Gammaproteobacteria bacterium]|nr:RNB domain-containing ribonuclease [Gammaproteobacteria bacterium]